MTKEPTDYDMVPAATRMSETTFSPTPTPARWSLVWPCLALVAITLLVFGQTMTFDFVNYDDDVYVSNNASVAAGLTWPGLAAEFTRADCYLYHPLTMLSLMLDHQLYGLQPRGYHLTNLLLHTVSVVLLFLVLQGMTGAFWRSAFVAAIFAIHPLRAESVAWIAERKDVLSGGFFILTIGAYALYVRKNRSWPWYGAVVLLFTAGLLCKPTLVTLPFVLLLLDFWPLRRFESLCSQPRNKYSEIAIKLVIEKLPLFILAAAACAATVWAAEKGMAANGNTSSPLLSRAANAIVSSATYLRQTICPTGLAAFYPRPSGGFPAWVVALSLGFVMLLSIPAFTGRSQPWYFVGWFWFLGMLTPMLGLVQAGDFAHADRMTYLPQIGLAMAFTWLAADFAMLWQIPRPVCVALMVFTVLGLMIEAARQTAYWKNSQTLWRHALDCDPNNYVAHYELGQALMQKADVDGAMGEFSEALRLQPDYVGAHYNLAIALREKGRIDDAIAQYKKALQIDSNYSAARLNLGDELLQSGKVSDAIVQFEDILRQDPANARVRYNLGIALERKGDARAAVDQYQHALAQEPANPNIQNNLAWLLATCPDATLRNGPKALDMARRANAATHGENPLILDTLAAALAEAGDFSNAVRTASQALRLAGMQSNQALATDVQAEIRLYQAGKPLRTH